MVMTKIKPSEIYDDSAYFVAAEPGQKITSSFLGAVMARLGEERFPLAKVSRQQVQIGAINKHDVVIAEHTPSNSAVFVCLHYGHFASLGLYLLTNTIWFRQGYNADRAIKSQMGSFEELAGYVMFKGVMQMVLRQVCLDDLGATPNP